MESDIIVLSSSPSNDNNFHYSLLSSTIASTDHGILLQGLGKYIKVSIHHYILVKEHVVLQKKTLIIESTS